MHRADLICLKMQMKMIIIVIVVVANTCHILSSLHESDKEP